MIQLTPRISAETLNVDGKWIMDHLFSHLELGRNWALHRQPYRRAQSAQGTVAEHEVAAVGAGDIAGDGEAEADAAGLQVAALVQPVEGAERLFALRRRDTGSVVVDLHFGKTFRALEAREHLSAVLQGVVDQVDDAALERVAPHRQHDVVTDL